LELQKASNTQGSDEELEQKREQELQDLNTGLSPARKDGEGFRAEKEWSLDSGTQPAEGKDDQANQDDQETDDVYIKPRMHSKSMWKAFRYWKSTPSARV
jgi:hypothetical protein